MEASSSDTSSLPDTEQEVEPTQYPYDLDIAHQLYEDQVENFMRQQRGEPLLDVDLSKDNTLSHQLRDVPTVQLRPHTNSNEVPCTQHTNADRRRLLMRLESYSLGERIVKPDGNCQFRAVSDQLFRTPEYHRKVRQAVIGQVRANRERYEPYVPQDFDTYCQEMDRDSVWGDHVTLQAAADWYGVEIRVLSSFMTECCIDIQPENRLCDRLLYLSFWAEVHYNSLYPLADMPKDPRPRKLLGSRRLFNLITSPPPPTYI